MHRQIAGKLTGRVTKWIVLAAWIVVFVVAERVRRQAHRRPEQRGLVAGSRPAPSPPRSSTSSPRPSTPTTSPPSSSTTARPGSPRTTSPRWTSRRPRSPRSTASRRRGSSRRTSPSSRASPSSCSPRTARSATSTSSSTSARTAGPTSRAAADEVRDIAQIDGVNVHLAGYGGQAADSAEAFEGIDTNLILITLLVVIVILLLTYRSPILWLLPIISAVVRLHDLGRRGLPAGEVRRPHRQRPEPGDPGHPGDRRGHRLRPARSWRGTARSCAATRTVTRRWRSRCTAPRRRSWRAPPRSSSACSA